MTQPTRERSAQSDNRKQAKVRKRFGLIAYAALAIGVAVFIRAGFVVWDALQPSTSDPVHPTQSVPYLGVYEPGAPDSYTNVDKFAQAIGRQPNLVTYYSHWMVPFNVDFATDAEQRGAVTLVQIAPQDASLASIAKGHYDGYLRLLCARRQGVRLPGDLVFRSRDEWVLVFVGPRACDAKCIREGVAARCNALPPGRSQECHLAVDGQHYWTAHSWAGSVVAWVFVCELGRN